MTSMTSDLIQIAKDIISKANSKGFYLKAIGRIGVALSCGKSDVETSDIDLFGIGIKEDLLIQFFRANGFPRRRVYPDSIFFWNNDGSVEVDVYLNVLRFAFTIPGPFQPCGDFTIPITQLFLSKLYISDRNWRDNDKQDLISILQSHDIGKRKDWNTIQIGILQDIWCCNSDSYTIFSFCEKKLLSLAEFCDDDSIKEKIEYLLDVIRKTPKKCPYKFGKSIHYGSPNEVEDAFLG